jgi:hypothetical protein
MLDPLSRSGKCARIGVQDKTRNECKQDSANACGNDDRHCIAEAQSAL